MDRAIAMSNRRAAWGATAADGCHCQRSPRERAQSARDPFSGEVVGASFSGGDALLRWTRALGDDSELKVQTYYDREKRNDPVIEIRDTLDADVQLRLPLPLRQDVVVGSAAPDENLHIVRRAESFGDVVDIRCHAI